MTDDDKMIDPSEVDWANVEYVREPVLTRVILPFLGKIIAFLIMLVLVEFVVTGGDGHWRRL